MKRSFAANSFLCAIFSFLFLMLTSFIAFAYQRSGMGSSTLNYFPLLPSAVIEGTAASGGVIGGAESLIPVYGSRNNGIFFVDAGGQYDNHDAFLTSAGLGLRGILMNQIVAAYLFSDYTRTNGNGTYFILNPGLEWMSLYWDAHINGYFPTSHRKQTYNRSLASTLGNYNFVRFSGHTQFDQLRTQYGVVGNGIDAEVGYSFPLNNLRSRVYAGGYHYAASHVSSINGVQVGFELPIHRTKTLVFSGGNDNVFKLNGAITIRVYFGSTPNSLPNDVSDRLVDPIPRHLGTLNTAASIPSQKLVQKQLIPVRQNIWFFLPGTSTASGLTDDQGTFEHPSVGINQNIVNSIGAQAPNAIFYFAPGQYFPIATPTPMPGTLTLVSGQSWWGREAGYIMPAQGTDRAVLNGGLQLPGDNLLDSLQIVNGTVPTTFSSIIGVNVLGTSGSVKLNNLNIIATDYSNNGALSILAQGSSPITVDNSTLNAVETNVNSNNGAEGIALVGANAVTVNHTIFNSNNTGNGGAYGIFVEPPLIGTPTLTVNNSTLNISDNGAQSVGIFVLGGSASINGTTLNVTEASTGYNGAFGVVASGGNTAIINSTINTLDNGANDTSGVFVQGAGTNMTVTNTTIYAQENGTGQANGIFARAGSSLTVNNSTINVISTDPSPGAFPDTSVDTSENSTVVINNTSFNLISNGHQAIGAFAQGSSNITIIQSFFTNISSKTGLASGVQNSGTGTIGLLNTNFIINGTGATFNSGLGRVTVVGGVCIVNGVVVPCS